MEEIDQIVEGLTAAGHEAEYHRIGNPTVGVWVFRFNGRIVARGYTKRAFVAAVREWLAEQRSG